MTQPQILKWQNKHFKLALAKTLLQGYEDFRSFLGKLDSPVEYNKFFVRTAFYLGKREYF